MSNGLESANPPGASTNTANRHGRWWRVLRHLRFDAADARRVLSADALRRIEARVVASETRHSGEIRVCIEASLPLPSLLANLPVRARALALFGELLVWDTEHNNGVLIYLLVAEHAIEIVADRGLTRHVDGADWQPILLPMQAAFRAGQFEAGLHAAIDAIDALLREHFAVDPALDPAAGHGANANELPDPPWVV